MTWLRAMTVGLLWSIASMFPLAAAAAETIGAAIQKAIDLNPEVRSYDFERRASDADVDAVKAGGRPKLGVAAQGGYRDDWSIGSDSYGLSVSLTQTLYDGGETRALVRRSRAQSHAAERRYEDAVNTIGLQTAKAYIEVQRTRNLVEVTRRNVKALSAIAALVKQRVGAGVSSKAELYQAEARVAGAQDQLESARQQKAEAELVYNDLTGEPPGNLETAGAPRKPLPRSVEEAVRRARERSPKILAVSYDAAAADAAVDAASSAFLPRLNLRLSLDYDAEVDGIAAESKGVAAFVSFKYDLYDGGVRSARARQSRERAAASHQDAAVTSKEVELEIRRSWNAIASSQRRLDPLKRRYIAATKSLALNLQRFGAGKATLETLLSLQDDAASSEAQYLNEVSSGRFHAYRILAATGSLLPALGLQRASLDTAR